MTRPVVPVPEEVVRLRVNGRIAETWSCSPAAFEALAAGRLLAAGYVRERRELQGLRVTRAAGSLVHEVVAEVPAERAAAVAGERSHRAEHGCGLRFLVDCRPDLLPPRGGAASVPDPEAFAGLFRRLFEASPTRKGAGGHHTAALSDGESLRHVHEEVGRHNGVDKAIGAAFLADDPVVGLGVLTTARISGEIAEKAARAGVAWVASRSVPTTLAVAIAGAAGLPLVGRAASPDARVFRP